MPLYTLLLMTSVDLNPNFFYYPKWNLSHIQHGIRIYFLPFNPTEVLCVFGHLHKMWTTFSVWLDGYPLCDIIKKALFPITEPTHSHDEQQQNIHQNGQFHQDSKQILIHKIEQYHGPVNETGN